MEWQCKVVDNALLYDDNIEGNFYHTNFLKLCGDNGIKFNKEKFQFCQWTLLGRHLRDALPGITKFYQIKKEFVMEQKERELLAAKLNTKMAKYYNRGSEVLPELAVGDNVRIQNHTTVRTTRWDRTGVIIRVLRDRQYKILVDGSQRLTVIN